VFTGIVEELGEVVQVTDLQSAARLAVRASSALTEHARRGDSYAVNGVCLTVTEWVVADPAGDPVRGPVDGIEPATAVLQFDVMRESLDRTSLGALRAGSVVNLERPTQLGGRLGGHLVQGHVDGVGTVRSRQPDEHWEIVDIALPTSIARYVVEKGSIAVDGVSLTVAGVSEDGFRVSLIPETLARTTLGSVAPGSPVNLEVDVIGKYVERLLAPRFGAAS